MDYVLEINNLKKERKNFNVDVSFKLPQGHIMGFVGKNGAGKTTTIKSILNMNHIDSGEIKIFGLDHIKEESAVKQRIGVVMDSSFFEENWTLNQIGSVLKPFYDKWDDNHYQSLLKTFHLDPNKRVKELSRGMNMKIMIAAALAHDPDLLILDEPTSGLDAVARDELLDILNQYVERGNKSILFSTHITSDLEKIADYITFIDNGRILHSGTKDDLLAKYVIVKGDSNLISKEQKRYLIGYQQNKDEFSALTLKDSLSELPTSLIVEACPLDEMVVRFNKEGNKI